MAIQLHGVAVPTTLLNRGQYTAPMPRVVRRNGEGGAVVAGLTPVVWRFDYLTSSEFAYFWTTLGLGTVGVLQGTNHRLWNALGGEIAYVRGNVSIEWETFRGDSYWNVTVTIDGLAP